MSERICAALDQIPNALAKTGFLLEHQVAEEFKSAGWATIGGRYYADDVDGRARELDLVAYRAAKSKDLEVVTAVLVSCKKDEETTWAFMTKDKPKQDPNFDWDPLHYWTDVQPLRAYLENGSWKENYIKALGKLYENNFKAPRDVFAFQQIASQKPAPRNNKAIFDSIASLMKALDHEIEALPTRAKGRKRFYTFFLLSVIDAPLVDVSYSGKKPVAAEVDRLTHLARYMVRKRDLSALIHFVRSDKLENFVGSLSKLADANAKHMTALIETAYSAIQSNTKVQAYFSGRLKSSLGWNIDRSFSRRGRPHSVDDVQLGFEKDKLKILINVYEEDDLAMLNADPLLKLDTAKLLKEIARYDGGFVFDSDIPF